MNLILDHNQRLNIIAALDRLECAGRREAWAVCALQQKLDLNEEERSIIGWRKQRTPDGREFVLWSNGPALDPRYYDLDDQEIERITKALDKYPVILARDKTWWEPLIAQLPEPELSAAPTAASNGTQAALLEKAMTG
jgi:hypothetical protein